MKQYIYRDGRFVEDQMIGSENRGFRYADGFFETSLCRGKTIGYAKYRMRRIQDTIRYLRMSPTWEIQNLFERVGDVLPTAEQAYSRMRLSFVRSAEGYYLPDGAEVEVRLELKPYQSSSTNKKVKKVAIGKTVLPCDESGNHKLIAKHWQVLAALEAKDLGLDDLILLNQREELAECISGNLIVQREDKLLTPHADSGGLKGVVREALLSRYVIEEAQLTVDDLMNASGIYSTNSVSGLEPMEITIGSQLVKGRVNEDWLRILDEEAWTS